MARKRIRVRYHVIYLKGDQYLSRSATDIYDAHNLVEDIEKNGLLALGIYDPQDSDLKWTIDVGLQVTYTDKVLDLIEELKKRHP